MPADPSNCWVVMHADIGIENESGADCFTLYVTTPNFLMNASPYTLGRGLIIVPEFNWDVIENAIRDICHASKEKSWLDFVKKLSRHFIYEFEDCQGCDLM